MGSKRIVTTYCPETGKSEAIIYEKGKRFRGTAKIHEDDAHVQNQYTGQTIAMAKAEIKRNRYRARECERKIESMIREMHNLFMRRDWFERRAEISQKMLDEYIAAKDKFAKDLKQMREKRTFEDRVKEGLEAARKELVEQAGGK